AAGTTGVRAAAGAARVAPTAPAVSVSTAVFSSSAAASAVVAPSPEAADPSPSAGPNSPPRSSSASVARVARGAPTGTQQPSVAVWRTRVPSAGDSTSI